MATRGFSEAHTPGHRTRSRYGPDRAAGLDDEGDEEDHVDEMQRKGPIPISAGPESADRHAG